jgi:hypothetical protein
MRKTHPWRGKKMTPQPSAVHRLVSFQSDWSMAVFQSFMVPCCLLGSRVLLRKGAGIPEGAFAWGIKAALPLERGWLYSAVVDPRSNLCYFNCSRGRQNNNKRASPMRL